MHFWKGEIKLYLAKDNGYAYIFLFYLLAIKKAFKETAGRLILWDSHQHR